MAFTSASLPFKSNSVNYRRRRHVGFEVGESKGIWTKAREKVLEVIHQAIHASTGSPSDGMGGGDTESSTSTSAFIATQKMLTAEKDGDDWEVDEVVVGGDGSDHPRKLGMGTSSERTTTGTSPHHSSHDADSLRREEDNILIHHSPSAMSVFRSKWLMIVSFFHPSFDEESNEMDYQKQHWYSTKSWAFYGSLYLVVNWILYLILNSGSTQRTLYAQILFYGGLSLLTIPLPFLVALDTPLHYPVPFQIWFAAAVWYCGITETIQMNVCNFFMRPNQCFGKDFLASMYYTTALPALMMFVVSDRLYNAVLQVVQFVLLLALIIPVQGIYARNVVSFVLFSTFLQGLHYYREMTSRRLYLLNAQLKVAYKAQQKAQMAQARASHAKRRFASYIFHEVRVPLNNAAIAFNNITTSEALGEDFLLDNNLSEDVEALNVSLATVQQVLNDSLDLEKMDAGHFDIHARPFPLHRAIRSTLGPLIVSAAAKNLTLHVNFDERIDSFTQPVGPNNLNNEHESNTNGHVGASGRTNTLSTTHSPDINSSAPPASAIHPNPVSTVHDFAHNDGTKAKFPDAGSSGHGVDVDETWVVGDEVRLTQILTNLASNAVKFSPEGAEAGVTVKTIFVERKVMGGSNQGSSAGGGSGAEVARSPGGGAVVKEWEDGRWASGLHGDPEKGENVGFTEEEEGHIAGGDREQRPRPQVHPHQDHHRRTSQDCLVFRLEVSDSGPGIKPSDFADNQLFQPFAQTKVGKLNKNSTGLGLAIVRQIVSLSGGRLGVQSQRGRGATFWVELTLPIAQNPEIHEMVNSTSAPTFAVLPPGVAAAAVAAAPKVAAALHRWSTVGFVDPDVKIRTSTPPLKSSPESPGSMLQSPLSTESIDKLIGIEPPTPPTDALGMAKEVATPKAGMSSRIAVDGQAPLSTGGDEAPLVVLIVDDNMITRETMSRLLRKRGCIVDVAKDGKECLDMVLGPDAKMYDLISLDNDMPVMTGEDAVKAIRQSGRHDIFVVGCTGNALTEDQARYLTAGADRVLVKPLRFELLAEILDVAREKRRQRRGSS